MTRENKIYIISREDFNKIIEEGKKKGHTHCQIMYVGYCDRVVSFDSVAYKNISSNLEGHNVYFARTGFPVYANYNRFRYSPGVVGVSEKTK